MNKVLGALLCLIAPAAFAEKLCVTSFKGPGGETVRDQLADNLCVTNACVDPKKVTKGGKPDFAKAKKEKVEFFVTGTIKSKAGKRVLELQVQAKAGAPKLKKSFTYKGSGLPEATLESVLAALNKAMGLEAAPPKEEPKEEPKKEEPKEEAKKEEPKKEEAAEEAPVEKTERKRKEPAEPPPPPKEEERAKEDEEDAAVPRKPVKPSFVAAEVGMDLFSRSFTYNAPETNNLRSYNAGLVIAPAFRLELYPLALITQGFMSGLGIDGTFAIAVGLKSRRSGTDTTWPTSLQHWDASLRFRIRPIANFDAAIIPFVGYSSRTFSVGPGSDMAMSILDGLPNIAYGAIRPGIAGELPFSDSGFLVFAKFAVQIVLSSGQIISPSFFQKGSNFGIEGQLGAGYRIFGPVSLRLAFDFTRYGLGFQSMPTDTYRAGGAVDMYIGGNLAVRLTF